MSEVEGSEAWERELFAELDYVERSIKEMKNERSELSNRIKIAEDIGIEMLKEDKSPRKLYKEYKEVFEKRCIEIDAQLESLREKKELIDYMIEYIQSA